MAFTEILGKPQDTVNAGSYQILDSLYSDGAIILENATEILTGKKAPIEAGLPLIGFSYKPESLELLKYGWSQYPYLNKQKLTFSAVKETTAFSVSVISPITTGGHSVVGELVKRELLAKLLEKYCDAGGMFTVLTLWGTRKHCVLTGMEGVSGEGMDGTLFKMSFMKPNFDLTGADASMSDFMKKATNGAATK